MQKNVRDIAILDRESNGTKIKIENVFRNQIKALEKMVLDFKIVSVVLHLDEASLHMHIVGVIGQQAINEV